MRRLSRYSLLSLLITVSATAILLHSWLDAPRRSLANFQHAVVNSDLETANQFLTGPNVLKQYDDDGRYWMAIGGGGCAYGTRESWKISKLQAQPATIWDRLTQRRRFTIAGLRPLHDDVIFEVRGTSITVIGNIRPHLIN